MKMVKQYLTIYALLIINGAYAETAIIRFTGDAPSDYVNHKQPIEIFACNNYTDSVTTPNQTVDFNKLTEVEVPFGRQDDFGSELSDEYYISQYYIASPPLPNNFDPGKPRILGVLSSDHFSQETRGEIRTINMDYRLLKPIEAGFVKVDYSSGDDQILDCIEQGIDTIAINIRCPSFEYTEYGTRKTGKKIGLGKGIAQLQRAKDQEGHLTDKGDLLIPLNVESKQPLTDCTVEIVNDIIQHHQVFFGTADQHTAKIKLTEAYDDYHRRNQHLQLYCRARPADEPAAGCNPIMAQ